MDECLVVEVTLDGVVSCVHREVKSSALNVANGALDLDLHCDDYVIVLS